MQPYSAFDQFGKILSRADDVNTRYQNLVYSKSSVICPECQKGYECEQSMVSHFLTYHEGVKYTCNQCNYQTTEKSNLTKHIVSLHEGGKYACKQCGHQATSQYYLTAHIKSVHEGAKYACNQCNY